MTEIKIEKKKPIWPWILGLILLALIIYFVASGSDDDALDDASDDDTVEQVMDDDASMEDNGEDDDNEEYDMSGVSSIEELNAYISSDSEGEMGLDHVYSHKVLSMLIDATRDVASAVDVNIEADLSKANEMADHIMKNPSDLDHANKIKGAAQNITNAIANIQNMRFPKMSSNIEGLKSAVSSIDVGTQTLNQKKSVKDFYQSAARILTQMKNNNG